MINELGPQTYWQQTTQTLSSTWEKGGEIIKAITWIALRVLGAFFPLVIGLEIIFIFYQRTIFHYREEELLETITKMEIDNAPLKTQVLQLGMEAEKTKISFDRAKWETKTAVEEKEIVGQQRDEKTIGRAALEREARDLKAQVEKLEKDLVEAKGKNEELEKEKLKTKQQCEKVLAETEDIERQAAQAKNDRELFEEIDQRLDSLEAPEEALAPKKELETLLPLYEVHKQAYREMIQEIIETYPEDDPRRVPLKGLIDMSEAESRHQIRVSELLLHHNNLQAPYLALIAEKLGVAHDN